MRPRLPKFVLNLFVTALCVLMLAAASLSSTLASPQAIQEVPPIVGLFAEEAKPCEAASVVWDIVGAFAGPYGAVTAVIKYYQDQGCSQAVADAYAAVAQLYHDAYLEAESWPASPGYPVGKVHDWLGVLIQDFSGATDSSGNIKGQQWGAIIWGGGDTNEPPHYIGGSIWEAYTRAVNTPSVLGDGIFPGYPTSPAHQWNRVMIQDFSGGSWGITAIIGGDQEYAWVVAGNHLQAYIDADGSNTLGNPRGPVELNADGWYEQKFEDGSILELAGETKVAYYDRSNTPSELPSWDYAGTDTQPSQPDSSSTVIQPDTEGPAPQAPAVQPGEPQAPAAESSRSCTDNRPLALTVLEDRGGGGYHTSDTTTISFQIDNLGCVDYGMVDVRMVVVTTFAVENRIVYSNTFDFSPGASASADVSVTFEESGDNQFLVEFYDGSDWQLVTDAQDVFKELRIFVDDPVTSGGEPVNLAQFEDGCHYFWWPENNEWFGNNCNINPSPSELGPPLTAPIKDGCNYLFDDGMFYKNRSYGCD